MNEPTNCVFIETFYAWFSEKFLEILVIRKQIIEFRNQDPRWFKVPSGL